RGCASTPPLPPPNPTVIGPHNEGLMIDFATAFPNSQKVYDERTARLAADGPDITLRIPLREGALGGGEPPVGLYDTSGPQGHDVRHGLPKLRAEWVAARRRSGFVGT